MPNRRQLRIVRLVRAHYNPLTRRYTTRIESMIDQHKNEIIDLFLEEFAPSLAKSAAAPIRKAALGGFDDGFGDLFADDMKELYRGMIGEVGEVVMSSLGSGETFTLAGRSSVGYLRNRGLKAAVTMAESVKPMLQATLAQAFDDQIGIPATKRRLRETLTDFKGYQLERLARTETIDAANFGALEGYKQSGVVEKKEWVAHLDGRTSEECTELDGQIAPLNANFHQDDWEGQGPTRHPNCRCTVAPVI